MPRTGFAELTRKARLKRRKRRVAGKRTGVLAGKKRFKASSGKYAQLTVLDANTDTFGSDLLSVFRENVAEARKENMRLFGSPDRVTPNK